jgi:gliding motility-associated-like protein
MGRRCVIFITVLFWLSGLSLYAQIDLRGTDFWLTFGRNQVSTSNPGSEINMQIRIVGSEKPTKGTIYFTNLDTSVTFSIAAGQVYTYSLSDIEKQAVSNLSTEINNRSIHITTSELVTAYALNQCFRSTDASNIFPTTVLGNEYYLMSYTETVYHDGYAIIATQDSTQIYRNGILINTINAGELYHRANPMDATGTHITANKPVAVFTLHQGAQIPNGHPYVDILFQQLAPVNTYGKTFFVPVSLRGRDIVRILASKNGTNITQTGGVLRRPTYGQYSLDNLNAGQWVELEISLDDNGCYIQADKPVGVCAYLTGTTYNQKRDPYTGMPTDSISDPAQAWLPAIEQKINTALIAPFIPNVATNLNNHRALILTSTATKDKVTVKIGKGAERPLSGGTWRNHSSGNSFYDMPLTNDTATYTFINREDGLIIMGYGIGDAESYYYLSFSAMRTLDAAFFVNDVNYQSLSSHIICTQPTRFRAEIQGDVSTDAGYLKWYIDEVEEIAARDQRTWSKYLVPNTYKIKMVVLMEDNIITKTVEKDLKIDSASIANTSGITTICVNDTVTLTGMPSSGRWQSMNPAIATVSNGTVTGISAGNAEIKYIIETKECIDTASTTIHITQTTIDATTSPEICERENGTITLTTRSIAPATVKYRWEKFSDTIHSLSNLKAGTYKVTVSDMFCVTDKTVIVEHIDAPIANFDFDKDVIRNHLFYLTDKSKGTVQTWEWDMGDETNLTGKTISHKYPESGFYKIFLMVIDTNDCTDTISKMIYIYDELNVLIPNSFTPNGDGLNDRWKPFMRDYSKEGYQLAVYDRWGNRVFHTTNTEESWDGTVNGKEVENNTVYSYQVIVKNVEGKKYEYAGSITLLR